MPDHLRLPRASSRFASSSVLAVALLSIVLPAAVVAATPAPSGSGAIAQESGPTQEPAARDERVDALFEEFTRPGSPGAAIAVIQDGEIVYERGYGLANLELEVPITPQSVFYLGSVSKQFVATAIALLEQDGKLTFGDDIREHIPEMPDYGTPITIRHLIHHTSGIRDYLGLMGIAGLPLGTFHDNQSVVDLIARQKALNFSPGERYLYSNSGYFLLAVIVERASGKTLREFAQERIFRPLGMENTHFHDDYAHLIPRRASAYFPAADGFTAFLTTFDRVGSGGVFSTVEDLFKWDQNFYHHRVGGPELHKTLHTVGTLNSGQEISYAFGLEVGEYRGVPRVEHGGALGGYRSNLVRFPVQSFSVAITANIPSVQVGSLAYQIADIYMEDVFAAAEALSADASGAAAPAVETVEVPLEELERVVGDYWNDDEKYARRILLRAGKLIYHRGPGNETDLGALGGGGGGGGGRFIMLGTPVRVEVVFVPASGKARRMVVDVQGEPPVTMEAYEPWKPSDAELERFAGAFYSGEVEAESVIEVVRGGLVVTVANGNKVRFTPVRPGVFHVAARGLVIEFRSAGGGELTASAGPTSFLLHAGRVMNLVFERVTP